MNRVRKPLIIVTGPNKRFRFGWWGTRLMLWMAGLKGYNLTPGSKKVPKDAQGVIIGGGDDIQPEHYGLTGDAGARYDPDRDQLEMHMVRQALSSGVPILGICRGAQLINVVLGGSLHKDIRPKRQQTPNRNSLFPIKWADLIEGSRLRQLLQAKQLKINSLHNQAIDRVGDGLSVAARDRDNFIQAVETRDHQYDIIGVQWHPEYMPYSANQRRLFQSFASKVRECNKTLICELPERQN